MVWIAKLILSLIALGFIFSQVDIANISLLSIQPWFDRPDVVVVLLALMPINWLLEALRWKISMKEGKVTFSESLKRVLSGLALNWVIPFTLGDASSRLVGVTNYKKSAIILLKNRLIMFSITLIFGTFSLLYYFHLLIPIVIFGLVSLASVSAVWFYHKVGLRSDNSFILIISLIRYVVFTFQFVLLMAVFLPHIQWLVLLLGVGWTFFFRTLIPSLFGNFGIREASAFVFFEPLVLDMHYVLIPCLLIWLVNTVLPSLVGVLMIFRLRFDLDQ